VLFTFIARQMARHSDEISVNRALFEQVVESLCLTDSDLGLDHEQRQQALLELYEAGGLTHFDDDRLVDLAWSAAFYRVCERVYETRRQYDKIVTCYWRDPCRSELTFSYVQSVWVDQCLSANERQALINAVLDALCQLISVDALKTARLLVVTLSVSVNRVIEELDNDDATLYSFMSGLFELSDIQPLDPGVYERYVDIMCRLGHSPTAFLRSTSGYRLAETIDICRRHSATDALVYLMERCGDIRGAFDLLFERVRTAVSEETLLETCVDDVVGLLHRGSHQLDQADVETVWFKLLDVLMDTMRRLKASIGGPGEVVQSVTRRVINAMMLHVPLPAVLQRVLASDDGAVASHFGDVRDVLTGLLDACSYERTLLSTCSRLVAQDLLHDITALILESGRATSVHSDSCLLCQRQLLFSHSQHDLVCFRCGHVAHRTCLVTSRGHVTSRGGWQCSLCRPRSRDTSSSSSEVAAVCPSTPPSTTLRSSEQLNSVHVTSVDRLRTTSRCPSRLTVLAELAQMDHTRTNSLVQGQPRFKTLPSPSSGILHNEQFALRLAVPPHQ